MLLRKNIFPKDALDAILMFWTIITVPTVYWFELFVVLPYFFTPWGFLYTGHFALGTFIFFNIVTNYALLVLCDTSTEGRSLPLVNEEQNTLQYCKACEVFMPPRSWHCPICNICILKRDHHCLFSGCCVGFYNMRYFVIFMSYVIVATLYCIPFNIFYAIVNKLATVKMLVKLVVPVAGFYYGFTMEQVHAMMVFVVLFTFMGILFLFIRTLQSVLKGIVLFERYEDAKQYDLGLKKNIMETFGRKWYLVWIAPFVKSQLPHDGTAWNSQML